MMSMHSMECCNACSIMLFYLSFYGNMGTLRNHLYLLKSTFYVHISNNILYRFHREEVSCRYYHNLHIS